MEICGARRAFTTEKKAKHPSLAPSDEPWPWLVETPECLRNTAVFCFFSQQPLNSQWLQGRLKKRFRVGLAHLVTLFFLFFLFLTCFCCWLDKLNEKKRMKKNKKKRFACYQGDSSEQVDSAHVQIRFKGAHILILHLWKDKPGIQTKEKDITSVCTEDETSPICLMTPPDWQQLKGRSFDGRSRQELLVSFLHRGRK